MSRLQANLFLLTAALIWGSSFVVQKIAFTPGPNGDEVIGSMTFTASRFLLGGLIILPLALGQLKKVERDGSTISLKHWLGIGLTGIAIFAGASLQQTGIIETSVTNAGFLTILYVPLVPVIALLVLGRKPHWAVWPAVAGCVLGTYLLTGTKSFNFSTGDLWVISSVLFWACHVLLVGAMATRTRAPMVVACGQFLVCALIAGIWGLVTEAPSMDKFSGAAFEIIYTGILSIGLGFTLQVIGQRHTPPADAAIILSSEVVFAAFAGALFLGERISPEGYLGCALILGSVLSVEFLPFLKNRVRPARV